MKNQTQLPAVTTLRSHAVHVELPRPSLRARHVETRRHVEAQDRTSSTQLGAASLKRRAFRSLDLFLRTSFPKLVTDFPRLRFSSTQIALATLPQALSGLRILHLSDLHLDFLPPNAGSAILQAIGPEPFDFCVVTGDISSDLGDHTAVRRFFEIFAAGCPNHPLIAVLGNHDHSNLISTLEDSGVVLLLNDNCRVDWQGASFWIAGVDDHFHFRNADLTAAVAGVPRSAFLILLAHSPDVADQASHLGCPLYLCGHTHGGHICIMPGHPLGYRRRYPPERIAGFWNSASMVGFTSRGIGSFEGFCRVLCPPEVTLHTLLSRQ